MNEGVLLKKKGGGLNNDKLDRGGPGDASICIYIYSCSIAFSLVAE